MEIAGVRCKVKQPGPVRECEERRLGHFRIFFKFTGLI